MFGEPQTFEHINCIGTAPLKENSYQSNTDIGCFFKLSDCLTWSWY
jgi:hypothetical protein